MSDRRAGFRDWPNREASRFVRAGGFGWHVQVMGEGPVLLLLHGTGAATHSWRALMPLLARRFTVVAPDLPGHGFTESPARQRFSLPGMAGAVRSLLQVLDARPEMVAGHSAGAAVGLRLVLDGAATPAGVVGLNAALLPLQGAAGKMFSPLAKLLVGLPVLPGVFAWRAKDVGVVERLLRDTGSSIDREGVRLYARLMQDRRHTGAALSMMAHWELQPLVDGLPRLGVPVLLIVGEEDKTVPPTQSETVAGMVDAGRVERMAGLGHLAHEEDPARTAALIEGFAREMGILE